MEAKANNADLTKFAFQFGLHCMLLAHNSISSFMSHSNIVLL